MLPWRAGPGERPDPYRVWLSEIMLQQTTVRAVAPYFLRFVARWSDFCSLAAAPREEVLKLWAGLGYYARARNLHACAGAVVERHGGELPPDVDALRALPGIGPYTAAAIAAIAFDARAAAVDGNVERVVARVFAIEDALPAGKPVIRELTETLVPQQRAGDFAQALMDLGATICTPKKPACVLCPWRGDCRAAARGDAETFPRKAKKRTGAMRRGAAFVLMRCDGFVLVRARPSGGLLGAMTEVPTTEWSHDFAESDALAAAPRLAGTRLSDTRLSWRKVSGVVAHVFTHFPLELSVYTATATAGAVAPAGARWVAIDALSGEALPSLMRKVLAHAVPAIDRPRFDGRAMGARATAPVAKAAPLDVMEPRPRASGRRGRSE
jgi:A/G-specific adenine glycosylase